MTSKTVIFLSAIVLASMLVAGCGPSQGQGTRLQIKVENADYVGAITFTLMYDPSVIEVTGVRRGPLSLGGALLWGVELPGQLSVVIRHDYYLNGDGTLIEVSYHVLDSGGSSTLTVHAIEALSLRTGDAVQVQVSEGGFSASDMSVKAPEIIFGT